MVHGDLKAPNVLLTSVGGGVGGARVRAKLADFGLSKMLPGTHEAVQRTTVVGTVQYMSPELLETGRLTRACDVYGFGILSESLLRRHDLWRSSTRSATYSPCPAPPPPVWEVWTGELAFADLTAAACFYAVVHERQRPPVPPDCPQAYAQLMLACWRDEPDARCTIQQVLDALPGVEAALGVQSGDGTRRE